MNFLDNLIPENLIDAFGWMIIHSVWQGALVALLLSIALLMLNKRSARIRYIASVGALLFFAAIAIRTFAEYYQAPESTKDNITQQQVTAEKIAKPTITDANVEEIEQAGFIASISEEFKNYFKTNLPLIVTLYLLGVLFLTLKLTGGFLYSQRIKKYRTQKADSKFIKIVSDFSERLQIKQKVKLVESAFVKVPVTLGYLKPVILFPIGTLTGLSWEQVETIIAHELAHIKRADYIINLFQSMLEVVFFYHPAIWWISSIIREERENVCDDLALEVSNQPAELARALVFISQFDNGTTSFAMSAIGNKNKLLRRIKRMMGENKQKTFRGRAYAASLMLLAVMSLGAIACSTANGESFHQDKRTLVYEEKSNGDSRYINTDRLNEDEKTYIFYKRYRGEKSKWEVTIEGDRVTELYKDGDLVPNSELYKYEDMLLDKVDEINYDLVELNDDLEDLNVNLRGLKVDLGENFAEDMRRLAADIKVEFDSDEFKRDMEELKDELSNMDFHFDFEWDSDEFKSEMRDLSRELANIKVDIDLSDFNESMRDLKEELSHLDIDMSDLKKEMEILGDYLDELKDEMISDGVIDDEDDFRNINFDDDGMYVNHEKVSHELYLKYREIYKKYYDSYPDEDSFRRHHNDRW